MQYRASNSSSCCSRSRRTADPEAVGRLIEAEKPHLVLLT